MKKLTLWKISPFRFSDPGVQKIVDGQTGPWARLAEVTLDWFMVFALPGAALAMLLYALIANH